MAEVKYEVKVMNHVGGTKFYETAWFASGENFISVFRWGKMTEKDAGGGQTKMEIHTALWKAQKACDDKQNEKRKRGYEFAGGSLSNSTDKIALMLGGHYSNVETVDRICELLGEEGGGPTPAIGEVVMEEPEIVRGEEWGSW